MEGVSSLPGSVYSGDIDRTIRELENAIKDVQETLNQV
jgi:hypothetical protein